MDARAARWRACRGGRGGVVRRVRRRHPRAGAAGAARRRARAGPRTRRRVLAPRHRRPRPAEPRPFHGEGAHRHARVRTVTCQSTHPVRQLPNEEERHEQHERQRGRRRPGIGPDQPHPPTPRARRHRLVCRARSDGGHHPRRCACPGRWRRLRGPRWWRNDPVGRVRRGDRRLLGRGHRHCRRSSSLERSPRRAIRVDGSVADRDLVGPAPFSPGQTPPPPPPSSDSTSSLRQ